MEWLIPVLLALSAAALVWRARRAARPRYLAEVQYWVYMAEPKLPNQDAVMDRMINGNPHNRPGRPCIGAREGLLFSDVRLRVAAVARSKNPHVFRPDLFEASAEPTAEILRRLAGCQGMARVRYLSEVPLEDDRHLRFVPHLADAYKDLAGGVVVYDEVSERFYLGEEFGEAMNADPSGQAFDTHVRVAWRAEGTTAWAETRGLAKKGMKEVRTDPTPTDQRILVTELLEEYARRAWEDRALPATLRIERYEDEFVCTLRGDQDAPMVSIVRRVAR
jgi:hypothetical protein